MHTCLRIAILVAVALLISVVTYWLLTDDDESGRPEL